MCRRRGWCFYFSIVVYAIILTLALMSVPKNTLFSSPISSPAKHIFIHDGDMVSGVGGHLLLLMI